MLRTNRQFNLDQRERILQLQEEDPMRYLKIRAETIAEMKREQEYNNKVKQSKKWK